MAIQTKRSFQIFHQGVLAAEGWMEYDDADYLVADNGEGLPKYFRVVRWFGTNHSSLPLVITVKRGNGQNWVERTIPPGGSYEQAAGGPVKYETDVPAWSWRFVD